MFAPAHHAAMRFVVPVRKELGGPHDLQLPRPAHQPGRARRASSSASRTRRTSRPSAGALARLGVDRALVVSSEDGLDEMSTSAATQVVEVDGEELDARTSNPRTSACDAAPRGAPGGTPEENAATIRARSWPASPAPARDLALAQRRRGDLRRRRAPTRCARASRARRARPSTRAPPPATLERYVALSRELRRRERPRAHRRVDARATSPPPREVPLAELEQAVAARGDERPFSEALVAPRRLGHRRAQAPLAVRRARSARARRRPRSSAPTSAAAPPRCRSSPRARTSAARSTTCARRAPRPSCRSCARTSSSTPTRSTSRRRPAPTPCC